MFAGMSVAMPPGMLVDMPLVMLPDIPLDVLERRLFGMLAVKSTGKSMPNGMLFLVAASGMDFSGSIVETSFLIFIGQEIGATGILGRISFVFPFRDSGA